MVARVFAKNRAWHAGITAAAGIVAAAAFLYIASSYALWKAGMYTPLQTGGGFMTVAQAAADAEEAAPAAFTATAEGRSISIPTKGFLKAVPALEGSSFGKFLLPWGAAGAVRWEADWRQAEPRLAAMGEESAEPEVVMGEDGRFSLKGGSRGWRLDVGKAEKAIDEALAAGRFEADLSEAVVKGPPPGSDAKDAYGAVSWVNGWTVEYTDGLSLDAGDLKWCWDGLHFEASKIDFSSALDRLCEDYGTEGKSEEFLTADGRKVEVPYLTLARTVDRASEEEHLKILVAEGRSERGREPAMHGGGRIGATYVEVSTGAQHVWHFVDGVLCCESDCVTGTKGEHDTPHGAYCISEMAPGEYLKGDGYQVWVDRWMRITVGGIGLHDAPWRGTFGGSIYKSYGSHGCINLPPAYAKSLYGEAAVGTPVVVHD